jgi:sporulation protein YlmC with PRC-barrel domain
MVLGGSAVSDARHPVSEEAPMPDKRAAGLYSVNCAHVELNGPYANSKNRRVIDSNGEEIGRLYDLLVDDAGEVRLVRVQEGGFLGIGTSMFLIPVEAVIRITPEVIRVDRDREQVAAAPAYDPDELADKSHLADVYSYYGYQLCWAGAAGTNHPFT